jgi:hypothetical protein
MSHQLVQRGPKDWTCVKCHQTWQAKSKAHCPGLHVVKTDEWGTLMTKTMLGRFGYKNDAAHLPKPKACYRRSYDGSDPEYVMLYDRNECAPKKAIKKGRRKTGYLSEIVAPPVVVSLIKRFQEVVALEQEMAHSADHSLVGLRYEAAADMCNMIICAQLMTDPELAVVDFITLQIPPVNMPKGTVLTPRSGGVMAFAYNVLNSYEDHLNPDAPKLVDRRMLSAYDVSNARQRLRYEAQETRRQQQLAQDDASHRTQFEFSLWQTDDTPLPPAVQKSMFDDEAEV